MKTVDATQLKNQLGAVLEQAMLGPVAVARHGKIVAYLVPALPTRQKRRDRTAGPERTWNRRDEERVLNLCAGGDFRPSRWRRAGDSRTLGGIAAMLASVDGFDRQRMLALAERLSPGMSTAAGFNRWLAGAPVHAERFLPMLRAKMKGPRTTSPAAPRSA